jgi:predicted ATPase
LPALARLIAEAAARSQIIVVSHVLPLLADLDATGEVQQIVLTKNLGRQSSNSNQGPPGHGRRDST